LLDGQSERRKLGEAQLRHDVRVPGAETLVVLPRPPHGTSGIDQTTLGDHPPVLHLLGDQDFSNLRSRVHFSISPEKESGVLHSGTILVLDEPFLVGFDSEGIAEGRTGLRMPFLVFPLVPRNVELPSTVIFEVQRAIGFQLWNRDWAISPFLLNFHTLVDFYRLVCRATCSTQPKYTGPHRF
jgi:hypothetical protein